MELENQDMKQDVNEDVRPSNLRVLLGRQMERCH